MKKYNIWISETVLAGSQAKNKIRPPVYVYSLLDNADSVVHHSAKAQISWILMSSCWVNKIIKNQESILNYYSTTMLLNTADIVHVAKIYKK